MQVAGSTCQLDPKVDEMQVTKVHEALGGSVAPGEVVAGYWALRVSHTVLHATCVL